jgi:hypothetical protein
LTVNPNYRPNLGGREVPICLVFVRKIRSGMLWKPRRPVLEIRAVVRSAGVNGRWLNGKALLAAPCTGMVGGASEALSGSFSLIPYPATAAFRLGQPRTPIAASALHLHPRPHMQ